MLFMNEYDVEHAARQFRDDPVLGPATQTLLNLMDTANRNSDGWAYWPKPARAAAKLMELVQQGQQAQRSAYSHPAVEAPTATQVKAAYRPIKSFLTRSGLASEIVNP